MITVIEIIAALGVVALLMIFEELREMKNMMQKKK